MGLFDGIEDAAELNKRIEGESYLEFVGVDERNHKEQDKRMVIFKYSYVGPDPDFERETVTEFFTYYRDMGRENLKNYTDQEVANAKRAVKAMFSRLVDLGCSQEEVNNMTADPEEKVGNVIKTNVYYNKSGYLQLGNAKLVDPRAMDRPSDSSDIDDLLS